MKAPKIIIALALGVIVFAGWILVKPTSPTTLTPPSAVIATPAPKIEPAESTPTATSGSQITKSTPLGREQVVSAFASVLVEKSVDKRMKDYLTLLENLDASHAPAIYELLLRRGRGGKGNRDMNFELQALGRRWGTIDPQGAMSFLETQPASDRKKTVLEQVMNGWAVNHPAGAEAWLQANSQHEHYQDALLGVVSGHAQTDLQSATGSVMAVMDQDPDAMAKTDPRFVGRMLDRLADAAASESGETLKAWLDRLPSDGKWEAIKASAAIKAYDRLPKEDLEDNARWVGSQTGSTWSTGMIGRFAHDYARMDPEAAMNWVQTTRPKSDNEIVIGVIEIVRTWSERDMQGLGRWLETNRDSPVFNQATRDLAVLYADKNRDLAKYWGEQNTHPKTQEFLAQLFSKPPAPSAGKPPKAPKGQ